MKLEINTKLIDCSPFNKELEEIFNKSNFEIKEQLENDILYGNIKNYIISGYRGAGKTSLIKKIEENNKLNKNIVFVHLNISRLEGHNYLLRKLIRELYLTIKCKNIQRNDEIKKLQDLYNKTFFKIERYSKYENIIENETTAQIDFNYMKFISLMIGLILIGLDLKLNLFGKNLNIYVFIFISILLCFDAAKIVKSIKKLNTKKKGIDSSELFDDEISEYRLNEVLIELKKKIKIIFVIDELDKIDDIGNVEVILNNMKPLMLGGLASFIIIPGQKLVYKLSMDNTVDNSYLSDIFSKKTHVSFLEDEYFRDIFFKLIKAEENELKKIRSNLNIQQFIDYLILESNGIPRRFFTKINEQIYWENNKSYLSIEQNNYKIYESSSKLLNVLGKFNEQILNDLESLEQIDFIKTQIYIWINRMKKKGLQAFTKLEIFNISNEYKDNYKDLVKILDINLSHLIELLAEESIVLLDEDNITWNIDFAFNLNDDIFTEDQQINKFQLRLIEIDVKLRKIYYDLYDNQKIPTELSFDGLVHFLNREGVLSSSFVNINWEKIIKLRNKGARVNYTENEKNEILSMLKNMSQTEHLIYEDYLCYIINNFWGMNSSISANKSIQDKIGDIIINQSKKKIVLEIKYRKASFGNISGETLRLWERFTIENNENKFIVIWFLENTSKRPFEKIIKEENKVYKNCSVLFFLESEEHFNHKLVIENIKQEIESICLADTIIKEYNNK